jgi:hypothetical protein
MTPEMSDAEIIAALRERVSEMGPEGLHLADARHIARAVTLAERYLWLRRNPSAVFASVSGPFGPTLNSGDRLDAAIDAAMKGGET